MHTEDEGASSGAEPSGSVVLRLTGSRDPKIALRKYKYRWGNRPTMELMLDPSTHRKRLQVCLAFWVLCTVLLFKPLVFSHRSENH